MKKFSFVSIAVFHVLAVASIYAADIFVTTTGGGDFTGSSWSNAINGGNYTVGLNVQNAITAAVANSATEVNVYFAGGTYTTTNQISIVSIKIPVKFSGGYLGTADNSFERSESETVFKRVTYNIRFIRAASLPSLVIEGITFQGGYVSGGGARGGAIYLDASTTSISNCVFLSNGFQNTSKDSRNNSATVSGGGAVGAVTSGSLTLDDCTFTGNRHVGGGTHNQGYGAAVFGYSVSLNIKNCIFEKNYMDGSAGRNTLFGGAVSTLYGSLSIKNCEFSGNYIKGAIYDHGGAFGGAIAVRDAKSFVMTDSIFSDNYVANPSDRIRIYTAGILFLEDWKSGDGVTTSIIERCVFDSRKVPNSVKSSSANVTLYAQSDILLTGGSLFMTNNLIHGSQGGSTYGDYSIRSAASSSTSSYYHGYFYSQWTSASSYMELVNCTIADGKAYGAVAMGDTTLRMINSISSGHSVSSVVNAASIEYSCLQEEHEGEGNFVAEPLWTGAPYYHLITKAKNGYIQDGWFGGTFAGEKSKVSSPCIDAGAPDFANHIYEPHAKGRRINLGAYGGTPWASKTYYQLGSILKLR